MLATLYQKTDKGREEIATRKHQIDSRLRPLLVTINGTANTNELLARFAGNGMDEECFFYLEAEGFIEVLQPAETSAVNPPKASKSAAQAIPSEAADEPVKVIPATQQTSDVSSYEQITEYYSKTIKDQLGLKGVFLQIKVEKAMNIEQLAALRDDYYKAIYKSKGEILAQALVMRLDQLLESQTV
ncbi:hypothetical protein ACMYR3_06510 [Ampullimonas aquatilis]|uniref:hypothetical protein n=1 Tax=Ampullimonas aquatilis TaxID=1341549 RepID=UPI003C7372F4